MAGLRGNIAYLAAQFQTAKGTAATPAAVTNWKQPFVGGNLGIAREMDMLSETDSSRDQGVPYVVSSGVEGEPQFYARDATLPFWLKAALGSLASSGTTNYTHTATPSNSLPYLTAWRNLSDTLFESYRDCKVGSLTIAAEAGQPLTVTAGLQGVSTTRLTAEPLVQATFPIANGVVYNYNDATVTLGGAQTVLVRSFELGIENNLQRQQTDGVEPIDVYEGQREVTLSFDLIFDSLDEYNKFHYGSAAGTAISSNVFSTSAAFVFDKGANNQIAFNLPVIAYQELSPEPNPGGDPVVVSVRAVGQRNASPIVTATVKNQTAGTGYVA